MVTCFAATEDINTFCVKMSQKKPIKSSFKQPGIASVTISWVILINSLVFLAQNLYLSKCGSNKLCIWCIVYLYHMFPVLVAHMVYTQYFQEKEMLHFLTTWVLFLQFCPYFLLVELFQSQSFQSCYFNLMWSAVPHHTTAKHTFYLKPDKWIYLFIIWAVKTIDFHTKTVNVWVIAQLWNSMAALSASPAGHWSWKYHKGQQKQVVLPCLALPSVSTTHLFFHHS